MGWIKYGGKILKVGGKIAISVACCCDVECADCPWGTPSMGDIPEGETAVDTLYAHITAVEGCECLDGLCVTMTWRAGGVWGLGVWQGTLPIQCLQLPEEERFITLTLGCCPALDQDVGRFWLGSDDCSAGDDPAVGDPCPPTTGIINVSQLSDSQQCRPYNISFLNFPGLNCCGVMPATFNVVVNTTAC